MSDAERPSVAGAASARVDQPGPDGGPRRDPASDDDAFAELRDLLIGEELNQLSSIRSRLDDSEQRRREIADILPHVLLEHSADPRFTHALSPPVERAITASVRSNPGPLAEALFPVMGPAIRKAVASALAGMVEALNRTLEHSLSWRSLAWRIESWRTGKSFGEVMLLHTLAYRVEQIFLIERGSGLLLHHLTEGESDVRDADMVSGMLTAIRDFVQDSFRVTDGESLEALKVGELSVWIEQGPRAVLAAVIRGVAPRTLRTTLQQALERIHLEFADEFEQFKGDTSAFDGARPTLEACLHTEYLPNAGPSHRTLWAAVAIIALAISLWGGFALRARSRWNHYVEALKAEPGIVVVSTGRRDGKFLVSGLRDPLARDPASLLEHSSLAPADVDGHWDSYYAAGPSLALARAHQVLQPPNGVTLELKNGVLSATGVAPLSWLAEAARLAPLIPGVTRLDASAAMDAATREAIARIERLTPLFGKGQATLAHGQDDVLRQLVTQTAELARTAAAVGRTFRVALVGHTDADGGPEANIPLSLARAAFIKAALQPVAGDRLQFEDSGVGSDDPAVRSDRETEKQQNRRVTVKVTPVPSTLPSNDVGR